MTAHVIDGKALAAKLRAEYRVRVQRLRDITGVVPGLAVILVGFHLYNVGGLVTGNTIFSPCTPYGVQKLLENEEIDVEGRNVVVVGPMTVTMLLHNTIVSAERATSE